MARYSEAVLRLIYDKYVPRLASKKEGEEGAPDLAVLYFGPFLDGVSTYLPEIFRIPFWNTSGPEHARRHIKSMLQDTLAGDRARNLMTRDLRLTMRRASWEADKRTGRAPTVVLNDRLRDNEPGELLNSPQSILNPETGEQELMEQVHEGEYKPFVPVIREDKRYGLHYLKRGDEFSVKFTTRKGDPIELNFKLRALGEGSSLLTPLQASDEVAW